MFVRKSTYNTLAHEFEELQYQYAQTAMEEEVNKKHVSKLEDELLDLKQKLSRSINKEKSFFLIEFHDDMETVSPIGWVKDKNSINKLVERGYLASNKVDDEFAVHLSLAAAASDFLMNMMDAFAEEVEEPENE